MSEGKMKHYILAAVLSATAIPAYAWDNTTSGRGPQQIVDGGPGAQSVSRSSASSASAARSTAHATGGAAYGGSGGSGGSASNALTINGDVGSGGGGGGYRGSARAPDVFAPGGGGMDCPTVGFGASGAGVTGGGGFGPSWISSRCDHRKYAEEIVRLTGDAQAGLAYLASVEPDVRDFLKDYRKQPEQVAVVRDDGWCRSMDMQPRALRGAQKARYEQECSGVR